MGKASCAARAIRGVALGVQVGAAMALAIVTITQLAGHSATSSAAPWADDYSAEPPLGGQCALGAATMFGRTMSWCVWNYGVAGLAVAATIALGVVLALINLCGAGAVLDLLFSAALAAYWAYFASRIAPANRALDATQPPAPCGGWRAFTVGMFWVAMAMACLAAVVAAVEIVVTVATVCACCCGGGGGRAGKSGGGAGAGDLEAPPDAQCMVAPRPAGASKWSSGATAVYYLH